MRTRLIVSVFATAIAACGQAVKVNTSASPDANFTTLRTFRVLTPPARRDGRMALDGPMLDNSITNKAVRAALSTEFQNRGYAPDLPDPDFTVAYYASTREKLDVTQWDYGYPPRWGGWRTRPDVVVRPFTEGTVIIDVMNVRTHELIWRGQGVSVVSDDPDTYVRNVKVSIKEIVEKFPHRSTLSDAR